jgi:hypothetical protein
MADGYSAIGSSTQVPPMTCNAFDRACLDALLAQELAACSEEERAFFRKAACPPKKWQQSPWGDAVGGFWAVALWEDRVLWYNDIEDGFNVSRYTTADKIPDDEYWCNQDSLNWALGRLAGESGPKLGPP